MAERIAVAGAVQGVGFRPFVKALADRYHLTGRVKNSGGIVRILVTGGAADDITAFVRDLKVCAPAGAQVLSITREPVEEGTVAPSDGAALSGAEASDFVIEESDDGGEKALPAFVPDLAICDDCLAELGDPGDRRCCYPLISCARCGPRFTILTALPYDRERTTMRAFGMCPDCAGEYAGDPGEASWEVGEGRSGRLRRRHAQTISCHACGPQMRLVLSDGRAFSKDEAMTEAVQLLRAGGVLGLKGVGGFQLLADPKNDAAVRRVRAMKGREAKPFAVLFPSMAAVCAVCAVSAAEERTLTSSARPIVLLAPLATDGRRRAGASAWSSSVLGDSAFIGAFLPASGAHQMLNDACGPLVATSANRSGEPMLLRDADFAEAFMGAGGADGMLTHDRDILAPVDDSVAFVEEEKLRLIRRARGYVPLPVFVPGCSGGAAGDVLAFGADLKAAFAFARGDRIVLSQPFGDLENLAVRRAYLAELERLLEIYGLRPRTVVCDAHPAYHSARLAEEFAASHGLPAPVRVFHHHAHALAVMAEHGLSSCVALVCDGTGYGADGTIWGGEALLCNGASFTRAGHLPAFRLLGGDAASRDAALSAASLLLAAEQGALSSADGDAAGVGDALLAAIGVETPAAGFSALPLSRDRMCTLRAASAAGAGTPTTSAGRLFDAAACMLGIARENRFEGECAQALEAAAHRWLRRDAGMSLSETGAEARAYRFHEELARALVRMAAEAADRAGERHIVLAGGVFANRLLLRLVRRDLTVRGLAVHVGEQLPAGDGAIAVGQAYCAML